MSLSMPSLSTCLVLAVIALPAGFQWLADSAKWTEPAGAPGNTTVEALVPSEFFGLQALKLWDFDGRICSMQLEQSSFNLPSARSLDAVRFCEPKQAQSWKRADIGTGAFVTAVSVCTAQKAAGPQLHGVKLWGASIGADGKLKPSKDAPKLELSHCEKWSAPRACPAGSVVTGLRAHLADAESGAVGLSLRCHALASVPKSAPH